MVAVGGGDCEVESERGRGAGGAGGADGTRGEEHGGGVGVYAAGDAGDAGGWFWGFGAREWAAAGAEEEDYGEEEEGEG